MKRAAVALALAVVLPGIAHLAAGFQAPNDRAPFVGTWLSESDTTNFTTLLADGRFTTSFRMGLEEVLAITGRWQVRDGHLVWTYDGPNAPPGEDVNPIVEVTPTQFAVVEANGSRSTFFRTGVADPLSPALLPVAVGSGWILEDDAGQLAIRIGPRVRFADRDCYRVDWISGRSPYQSEYWALTEHGIEVAGRRVLGRLIPFDEAYLLLKRDVTPGDSWKTDLKSAALTDALTVTVGESERVVTAAGTFDAVPVTLEGSLLAYRRWYAPDVGLVQEEAQAGGAGINLKKLKARLR